MKPLALVVEGFTSFRTRVELDFSSLDLFAITGPTGAGKSSLIDAMVFALYGQVPRVGDDYKQLISHQAERLSVLFEFGVGRERYRIARVARLVGASQQRLERRQGDGWEPVADRAKEIRAEIESILGLDYEGFTRSVVLPQGKFDAFLKGEPKERRKILVALLGLGVYERMQQLANQKAAASRAEAEFIRRQIETDFASASEETLARLRTDLAAARAQVAQAEAALAAAAAGAQLAQQVRAARREADTARRDAEGERTSLAEAQGLVQGAEATRGALGADLERLERELASLGIDEPRYTALVEAKPRLELLVSLRGQLAELARERAAWRRQADDAAHGLAAGEAALPALERAEAEARAGEVRRHEEREAAHREHAALALRRGLKPGEPCPVCARAIETVPASEAPSLEAADRRLREAGAATRAAVEELQQQRLRVGQLRSAAESLGREAARLEAQEAEARSVVEAAVAELARGGVPESETKDAAASLARIQSEIETLSAARRARAEREGQRRQLEQQRAQLDASVAAARARAEAARSRIELLEQQHAEAQLRLGAANQALLALAARERWPGLEALPPGRDEADALEGIRTAAQKTAAEGSARVATLAQSVQATEQALVRSAELGERRAGLEREAALHKQLADLLKANELVAWIQEEALGRLAAAGSRHLAGLSQKRYELRLGTATGVQEKAPRAEQDFSVADHWNLGSLRSVKTLSGGETFLASLALALGLAESLGELSSAGRAGDSLESLFLDEGFGTLDAEALDAVVGALDALHGGQRTVGIVTHVRELAERLPARIEVRPGNGGSTAGVV